MFNTEKIFRRSMTKVILSRERGSQGPRGCRTTSGGVKPGVTANLQPCNMKLEKRAIKSRLLARCEYNRGWNSLY